MMNAISKYRNKKREEEIQSSILRGGDINAYVKRVNKSVEFSNI